MAAAVVLAAALAVVGAGTFLAERDLALPAAPISAAPPILASPGPAAPKPRREPPAPPAVSAEPAASAAPGEIASAPTTPAPADDPRKGALRVRSSGDHLVFLHGKPTGRTNEDLRVPCGPHYARLGERSPSGEIVWRSPGQSVAVPCRGSIAITLDVTASPQREPKP